MPYILGIETATDVCSVALAADGEVTCTLSLDRRRSHAERLVPMIASVLATARIAADDLDAVAVSAGPGSYTGLRIGLSTAQGIVVPTGARLIPVPSLAALAAAATVENGNTVVAAFRSRRAEVYAAAYVVDGAVPSAVGEPLAGPPADVAPRLVRASGVRLVVVGDGGPLLVPALIESGAVPILDPRVAPSASAVVRIAALGTESGDPVDLDRFEPYYLKEFEARPATGSVFDRLPF